MYFWFLGARGLSTLLSCAAFIRTTLFLGRAFLSGALLGRAFLSSALLGHALISSALLLFLLRGLLTATGYQHGKRKKASQNQCNYSLHLIHLLNPVPVGCR
jgi:hypothetical protein